MLRRMATFLQLHFNKKKLRKCLSFRGWGHKEKWTQLIQITGRIFQSPDQLHSVELQIILINALMHFFNWVFLWKNLWLSGESNPLRNFEALISPEEPYTPIGHENLTKSVYKSTRAVTTKNKYGKYGFDL